MQSGTNIISNYKSRIISSLPELLFSKTEMILNFVRLLVSILIHRRNQSNNYMYNYITCFIYYIQ